MRKILFYFHDVGGLNFCLPVIGKLSKAADLSLDIFCAGPSIQYSIKKGILSRECKIRKIEDIENILDTSKPDLLVTGTNRSDKNEIGFWKVAKEKQIRSICVIDYSMDPAFRFMKNGKYFFPDLIIVPDMSIAYEIKEKFGIDNSRVIICGHPYLESVKDYIPSYNKSVFYEEIGLSCDLPTISYFSDTISLGSDSHNKRMDKASFYGIDEKIALSFLIEALNDLNNAGQKLQIMIKHHPVESPDNLTSIIKDIKQKSMIVIVDDYDSKDIIFHSDAVFSIFGMPLLEAHIMKKPAFSICNSKIEHIVWARIPFDISTVKNAGQIRKSISSLPLSSINGNNCIDKINIYGSTGKVIELLMGILNQA